MKRSAMLIPTLREEPKDAEATSHKLMLRAGLIRKLASGVYSYLPLGVRVLNKVTAIIREEMNKAGAQEVLLPAIHPAEIWKATGRYEVLKDILMKVSLDETQEYVLGPTHEEIITELAAAYIASYKDMPINLYQIQTKFRNEARPRFGVIRSKEFIMKDAYSFDTSWEALDKSYTTMYETYKRIFTRCGLAFTIVGADSGAMGGDVSHEFMVRVPFGEDMIVTCTHCESALSREIAPCGDMALVGAEGDQPLEYFDTPGSRTIEELAARYKIAPEMMIKTIIYKIDNQPTAVLVRGDFEVCETKLKKACAAQSVELADPETIQKATGAPVGFAGPVGLSIPLVVDKSVMSIRNGVSGGNKKDVHVRNVVVGRDYQATKVVDIRFVVEGDTCPQCTQGSVVLARTLEIGHVFKLGTKYSKMLKACFADHEGSTKDIIMGCYGIGVNRILASAIELNADDKGIKWPLAIAPFTVSVVTVNAQHEASVACASELYEGLQAKGIDVLYDDRDVRAGVKFNDVELIGIPIVVVVGDRNLKNNMVEVKVRNTGTVELVPREKVYETIETLMGTLSPVKQ